MAVGGLARGSGFTAVARGSTAYVFVTVGTAPSAAWETAVQAQYGSDLEFQFASHTSNASIEGTAVKHAGTNSEQAASFAITGGPNPGSGNQTLTYGGALLALTVARDAVIDRGAVVSGQLFGDLDRTGGGGGIGGVRLAVMGTLTLAGTASMAGAQGMDGATGALGGHPHVPGTNNGGVITPAP